MNKKILIKNKKTKEKKNYINKKTNEEKEKKI